MVGSKTFPFGSGVWRLSQWSQICVINKIEKWEYLYLPFCVWSRSLISEYFVRAALGSQECFLWKSLTYNFWPSRFKPFLNKERKKVKKMWMIHSQLKMN